MRLSGKHFDREGRHVELVATLRHRTEPGVHTCLNSAYELPQVHPSRPEL